MPVVPDHELLRRVGEGGYGEVWLARSALGTYRAVKVVYRGSFKEEHGYEREFRGIQMFEPISRSSDGLLDILQAGRNDAAGYYHYVMELADDAVVQPGGEAAGLGTGARRDGRGGPAAAVSPADYVARTLASDLKRRRCLPVSECVPLAMNLKLALGHLHRHGLIHRDIKPANIIFVQGVPKLADIGLVTTFDESCSFVGTEGYIAPEGPTSPRADLFSLGKVLYEISTGKDRKDFPEPPTGLGEHSATQEQDELNAVILRACATDPADRCQSAAEFHADLALSRSGKSVRWRRVLERRLRTARKTLAVVGSLALLATAAYVFQRRQTLQVEGNLYVANMNLIQRDWEKANIERLSQLLADAEGYPGKGFEWWFWQRQLHSNLRTFRGRAGGLTRVAWAPDGTRIVTAGGDQRVIVWSAETGKEVFRIAGHPAGVADAVFSLDGSQIASAGGDGEVHVWNASEAGNPMTIAVGKRALESDVSASGHEADSADLWLHRLEYSVDGKRLAVTASDVKVHVLDSASGREELVLSGFTDEVTCVAFSPDGGRIATGNGYHAARGGQEAVRLWDAATGRELLALEGTGYVNFSPDGRRVVTSSRTNVAIVSDAVTGERMLTLAGHGDFVGRAAFSPDGRRIATVSRDRSLKIWDSGSGRLLRSIERRTRDFALLAFSRDGARVAAARADREVQVWDMATGRERLALKGHTSGVQSVAFSPDGKRLVTSSHDRTARVWDALTGRELLSLEGPARMLTSAAFAPDAVHIATTCVDGRIRIWEAATPSQLAAWRAE